MMGVEAAAEHVLNTIGTVQTIQMYKCVSDICPQRFEESARKPEVESLKNTQERRELVKLI